MLLYAYLHSFSMSPCAVETSLQQKPHRSSEGEWNCRERRIDIWFMFISFGPINQEDIFISVFVKAFHKKGIHFLDLLIGQFEGFIFRFETIYKKLPGEQIITVFSLFPFQKLCALAHHRCNSIQSSQQKNRINKESNIRSQPPHIRIHSIEQKKKDILI